MTLQGKGFFLFNLDDCEGGDGAAIAAAAKGAGLSHVILKVGDGVKPYGVDSNNRDLNAAVVRALETAGIEVWGWHYIYGYEPEKEAETAIQQIGALGLKGYVINAEKEYQQIGRGACASTFMEVLRRGTKIPIGLSSFGFPNFHPEFPWAAFLEKCDFHMPRVFWEQAHDAAEQLLESKRQCEALPQTRQFIPCGPAYRVTGWAPEPAEITDFLKTAASLGLPAVEFYHWDHCRKYLAQDWTAISEFSLGAPAPAPTVEPEKEATAAEPSVDADEFAAEFMTALNSRLPSKIAAMYDPAAVRTWADETLYGMLAIRDGYSTVFANLPQGISFTLVQAHADSNVHFLTWRAGHLCGETTLVLKNGKILQDLTFIN